MGEPKKWKAGIADETWKVVICGRDLHLVDNLLSSLSYYLTDAGHDVQRGLAIVRTLTGEQIVDALQLYKRARLLAVQNALGESTAPPAHGKIDEGSTGDAAPSTRQGDERG